MAEKSKLNLQNAELKAVCGLKKQFPPESLPEVAFVGKSNVGKSSLINRLLNRKNLARTSSAPGKTRTINFYEIDKKLMLVDLPGYGYAKVSQEEMKKWGNVIESYLAERNTLKRILFLVDIRHDPTADDRMMWDWISYYKLPVSIVATKSDKISRNARAQATAKLRKTLNVPADTCIFAFSSETGEGREALLSQLEECVEEN